MKSSWLLSPQNFNPQNFKPSKITTHMVLYSYVFSVMYFHGCRRSVVPSVMLSQAAQMKKVMPAPIKNIPREQPTSTMVTLGKNKLVWNKSVL